MSILYYSFPGRPFFLTKSIADNNSRAEHAQELPTTRLATTIEVVYRAVIDRAIPKKTPISRFLVPGSGRQRHSKSQVQIVISTHSNRYPKRQVFINAANHFW